MGTLSRQEEEEKFAEGLLQYLNDSPTAYHAVQNGALLLAENGFAEISEKEAWSLEKGGKYFIRKNNSALIAFVIDRKSVV